MSKQIIVSAPINSLSLGQVSYNILRELWRRKIDVSLFPVGYDENKKNEWWDNALKAYHPVFPEFLAWLKASADSRLLKYNANNPSLKIWHLNGSQERLSKKQVLLSFYECDSPTPQELNLASAQDKVFFSSSYARDVFNMFGCEADFVPMGFDEDIARAKQKPMSKDITHWILLGKAESRKQTALILNTWKRKYGGNPKHFLSVCVSNPFLPAEWHNQFFHHAFEGFKPYNVGILPYQDTNEKVNEIYASADIDLTGFAAAEGWNLPAFNATALGKWSIVTNVAGHRDWATKDNCILVEPIGKRPCYDGIFFHQGLAFNQGNFYTFAPDALSSAMEVAEKRAKTLNVEGLKLQKQFSYSNTVEKLIAAL